MYMNIIFEIFNFWDCQYMIVNWRVAPHRGDYIF